MSNFSVLGSPEIKVYFYQQLFCLHVGAKKKKFQHIQKLKVGWDITFVLTSNLAAINRQFKFLQLSCIFEVRGPDVVHKLHN